MTKNIIEFFYNDLNIASIESDRQYSQGDTININTQVDIDWLKNNFPNINQSRFDNYLENKIHGFFVVKSVNNYIRTIDVVIQDEYTKVPGQKFIHCQEVHLVGSKYY